MVTHNLYEGDERAQEGGTDILSFVTIVDWVSDSRIDCTGLVRWCWIKIKGENCHICRIVLSYQLCVKPTTSTMVLVNLYYQQ